MDMAIPIKSSTDVAKKWSQVTPARQTEYAAGVKAPRTPWAAAAKAAEPSYVAGIQAAATQGRYGKGITKAGDAAWSERASTVGPGRFAEGVSTSAPKYEAGFAPYQSVIASHTLPPRFPKGDPRNFERVRSIASALRDKKIKG